MSDLTTETMPAEDLAVTMIELNRLDPSPTQPRKRFNQETLDQLTESMKAHGFTLSALTVRPKPGDAGKNGDSRFEIVMGERRWRAATAAAIVRAPCFVRNLSDEAVVEQQLIENIQREDLTPIEEAEGYKQILALKYPDGKRVYTMASLAKRIGKSERSIFEALSLCNLDATTKTEVESGRLAPRIARLIGRIPDPVTRTKFAGMVLHPQKEEGPLSKRKAEELMHREFIRDLRTATFNQEDPDLVPVEIVEGNRVAGGKCTDCPLRAGNAPGVAEEVAKQKHSLCMNPACYERKQAAEWAGWQASETKPEKKRIALSQAQCAKLFAYGNQISAESCLVDLSEHPDGGDLKAGEESPGTWRTLTDGADIPVFVVRDRFMKVRELVKRDVAIEAARTVNKHKVFKTAQREQPKPEAARKEEEKKKEVDRAHDQAVLEAIVGQLKGHQKISATTMVEDFLAFLADREISATNPTAEFLQRYHLPIGGSALAQLNKWDASQLIALLVDLIVSEGGYCTDVHDDAAKWLKSIFDIDRKAIDRRVTEERAKPPSTSSSKTSAKNSRKKKTPVPKAAAKRKKGGMK